MIDLESGLDIDKLNFVRRRLSLDMNIDFTNSEIVEKLISMEFSSVINKSKYNDIESKFDKIRRKLSYELDREIKSSEVMPLILEKAYVFSKTLIHKTLEKAYVTSKTIVHKPRKANLQLIQEELSKGTTTKKCAEKFGVSIQTVFRYKAKLREMNY